MIASRVLKVRKKKSKNDMGMKLTRFLPVLCSFMRPYVWHKIWDLNCRASKGVYQKPYEYWPHKGFLVITFVIFSDIFLFFLINGNIRHVLN